MEGVCRDVNQGQKMGWFSGVRLVSNLGIHGRLGLHEDAHNAYYVKLSIMERCSCENFSAITGIVFLRTANGTQISEPTFPNALQFANK